MNCSASYQKSQTGLKCQNLKTTVTATIASHSSAAQRKPGSKRKQNIGDTSDSEWEPSADDLESSSDELSDVSYHRLEQGSDPEFISVSEDKDNTPTRITPTPALTRKTLKTLGGS